MTNVVKFTGKPPVKESPDGPYWAGQPLKDAFPSLKARTPALVRSHRLVIFDKELAISMAMARRVPPNEIRY